MRCTVLGPISVNGSVPGSPQERRLVAALLAHRGVPVSVDTLTDVLWGDSPPRSAANALQSKISRLRTTVGGERLRRVGRGYVLELPPAACDADHFDDLVRSSAGLEPGAQVTVLDEALDLWQGRAYEEFAEEDWARPSAVALEQRRLLAHERRLDALLAVGRFHDVVAVTEELIERDPFRESFWAARMRALAHSGRAVDAVRCYQSAREQFLDETGIPPSPALAALEQSILNGDLVAVESRTELQPVEPAVRAASTPRERGDDLTGVSPSRSIDAKVHGVPLVEREWERAAIDAARADAESGAPTLCLLSGGVGLGKTRLIDVASSAARASGARVLVGRCVPELHTPLGPLGQIMSAVGLSRPLVSPGGTAPSAHELDPVDGEETAATTTAVLRLLDRLVEAPTVVVLDDLQWADKPTADAIELLVAEAESRSTTERVPVMFIAAHRPLDPARSSHAALGRLRRSRIARPVELTPLSEAGVATFIHHATGIRPSGETAQRVRELSEGVPLLVGTLVETWTRRDGFVVHAGRLDIGPGAVPVAPADVDAALFEQWASLDEDAAQVVTVLASSPLLESLPAPIVAGLLSATLDRPVPEVLAALDTAVDLGLLVDGSNLRVASQRARGFVGEQVPRSTRASLLIRLIEELTDGSGDEDVPLAEKYPSLMVQVLEAAGQAGVAVRSDDDMARWARLAAETSLTLGDWPAAVHHVRVALAHTGPDSPDATLSDGTPLDLALGIASFRAHDEHRAQLALLDAADRAASRGDVRTEGIALGVLHRATISFLDVPEAPIDAAAARARLDTYIDRYATQEPLLAARACALQAEDAFTRDDIDAALHHVDRARRVIATAEAPTPPEVEFAAGLASLGALDLRRAELSFIRSRDAALAAGDRWVASWGAGRIAFARLLGGDLDGGRTAISAALELQTPMRLWAELALTRALEAGWAAASGDGASAIALAEDSERLTLRSAYPYGRFIALPVIAYVHADRVDIDAARDTLERFRPHQPRAPWPYRALVDIAAGDLSSAHELAASRLSRLPAVPTLNTLAAIVATAAVADTTDDADLRDAVQPLLTALHERGVRLWPGWPVPLAR